MSGEFVINQNENISRSLYNIKNILTQRESLVIKGKLESAFIAANICKILEETCFVKIGSISTVTSIINSQRKIFLNVTINKTSQFEELWLEEKKIHDQNKKN